MRSSEKRRDPRRTIRYPGLITLAEDGGTIPCALRNASQQGAQLDVRDPDGVPDDFVLVLGYDGKTRRYCHVVWRAKDSVGVEFREPPAEHSTDFRFGLSDGDTEPTPSA